MLPYIFRAGVIIFLGLWVLDFLPQPVNFTLTSVVVLWSIIADVFPKSFGGENSPPIPFQQEEGPIYWIIVFVLSFGGFHTSSLLTTLFFIRELLIVLFARTLLFVMGWELLPPNFLNRVEKLPGMVLIFSHTSYWDFYLYLVYSLAHPRLRRITKVIMKAEPFAYAGPLLRYFGCLPGITYEQQMMKNLDPSKPRSGKTETIIATLREAPVPFLYLVCPKGTILSAKWSSSWYHIAKALDCTVGTGGFDYEEHRFRFTFTTWGATERGAHDEFRKNSSSVGATLEPLSYTTLEDQLKDSLHDVVPLHPEQEVYPMRKYEAKRLTWYGPRMLWVGGFILTDLFLRVIGAPIFQGLSEILFLTSFITFLLSDQQS